MNYSPVMLRLQPPPVHDTLPLGRYPVRTDEASETVDEPNDWCDEYNTRLPPSAAARHSTRSQPFG